MASEVPKSFIRVLPSRKGLRSSGKGTVCSFLALIALGSSDLSNDYKGFSFETLLSSFLGPYSCIVHVNDCEVADGRCHGPGRISR